MKLYLCYWEEAGDNTVVAVFDNEEMATLYCESQREKARKYEYYWYVSMELNHKAEFVNNYKKYRKERGY